MSIKYPILFYNKCQNKNVNKIELNFQLCNFYYRREYKSLIYSG